MTAKAKKPRKAIPKETRSEVLFKSDLQCCVCQKRGDHIHHLDGEGSNNEIDNLALLCFEHHSEAENKSNLRVKLTLETIVKFRTQHYEVIENKRQNSLGVFNRPVHDLTEETLLKITKNAVIIIELGNLKERFFAAEWDEANSILYELNKFVEHTNYRLAYEVFNLLARIASSTRMKMPYNVALNIHTQVLNFFPHSQNENDKKNVIVLAQQCLHLATNIVYDAFIYLKNLAVAACGLTIIKFIYREAKRIDSKELIDKINLEYKELETITDRLEGTEQITAKEMVDIFKNDLNQFSMAFPMFPDNVMEKFEADRKRK